MKTILHIITLMLCLVTGSVVYGQSSDTTRIEITHSSQNMGTDEPPYDEQFSMFLLVIVAVAACFILVCIGVGAVLASALLLLVFALVSAGILSTAVMVGLYQKSWSKGFRTFVVLSSSIVCAIAGGALFLLFNQVVHWWSTGLAIGSGMVSGFIGGFILGRVICFILRKLAAYFKQKLKLQISGIEG